MARTNSRWGLPYYTAEQVAEWSGAVDAPIRLSAFRAPEPGSAIDGLMEGLERAYCSRLLNEGFEGFTADDVEALAMKLNWNRKEITEMVNVNDLYPSKYVKAGDLQGREVTVVMQRIEMEQMAQGTAKPILYFQGKQKGMVLNKTVMMQIAAIHGPETDGWWGKPITLYSTMVDFRGMPTPGVRVKAVDQLKAAQQFAQQHTGNDMVDPQVPADRPIGGMGAQPADAFGQAAPTTTEADLDDEIPF